MKLIELLDLSDALPAGGRREELVVDHEPDRDSNADQCRDFDELNEHL